MSGSVGWGLLIASSQGLVVEVFVESVCDNVSSQADKVVDFEHKAMTLQLEKELLKKQLDEQQHRNG